MFLEIALSNFTKKPLTYRYESNKSILGHRVKIPFGAQFRMGIVIKEFSKTSLDMDIKCIESVLDEYPIIDKAHLIFLKQVATYYHISLNELVLSALPKDALKENCITDPLYFTNGSDTLPWHDLLSQYSQSSLKKKIKNGEWKQTIFQESSYNYTPKLSPLTTEQNKICKNIEAINLLWGQTGSGKTEVYIHLIHQALQKKQQVLLLVPEIALTQQVMNKVELRLGIRPTLIHSLITPKIKLCRWLRIINGQAGIILGTRSALLYPIKNLGLIIVDEEHDNAYRQEQSLFFSARDAAILKATGMKIPIVLGSATPSLESYYNAQQGKYNLCLLEKRYLATQPKIHILQRPKHTFIAPNLVDIVKRELDKNHHIMLYIGKRGYSRLLKCHHCGYELRCPCCDRLLILHENQETKCHHCETKAKVIIDCPDCQTAELSHYGAGSQRISEIAQTLWPDYPVLRIDTDTMNSNEAALALSNLATSPATLIVGTQMLTKGHDIDRLDTVIVIDADHTLYAPDFRAEEKLFSELVQVSGRSGRRKNQGHVYIQTQSIEHMVFKSLESPQAFYQYLLEKRQAFDLPPYTYIACLFIRGSGPTLQKLQSLKLPEYEGVTVIGPCLFPPGQRKKQSCYQIMISSQKRPLRNHVFLLIHQLLKRSLPRNTNLLAQIDSHLSL